MKNRVQRCQAHQAAAELEDVADAITKGRSISESSELGRAFAVAAAVAGWIFEKVYRDPDLEEGSPLSLQAVLLRALVRRDKPTGRSRFERRCVRISSVNRAGILGQKQGKTRRLV